MSFPACASCAQMHRVEPCFECNQNLCQECLNVHYSKWKLTRLEKSNESVNALYGCKEKLDVLNPLFEKNRNELLLATEKIKKAYQAQLQRLNEEREALEKTLDNLISENNKITAFQSSINEALNNFNILRDPNDRYDRATATNLLNKVERNIETSSKIEKDFESFKNSSLKILAKFDEAPRIGQGTLIGRIETSEQRISSYQPPAPRIEPRMAMAAAPQAFHANTFVPFHESDNIMIDKWKNRLGNNAKRTTHFDFRDHIPHMCVFRNRLFAINNGDILVFETTTSEFFRQVNQIRIGVAELTAVAVNSRLLAVSYADSKASKIKHLTGDPRGAGVLVFKYENNTVRFPAEKLIRVQNSEFIKPKGIAMNESCLIVCDYELGTIFKFELEKFALIHKFALPNGRPYKVSLNDYYAAVVDYATHNIHLYHAGTMLEVNKASMSKYVEKDGPCDVFITAGHMLITKCSWVGNLMLLDARLEPKLHGFNVDKSTRINSFAMIEFQPNPLLVLSASDNKTHKLIIYSLNDLS